MKNNLLLIDKPATWTSFDVVAKIRGAIRAQYQAKGEKPTKKQLRVGHAGTLDPFATGLLIVLLGDGCKEAGTYLKLDKTYQLKAKLGFKSSTGDPEGEITESANQTVPSEKVLKTALEQFTGRITQVPPQYSAIKVNGQRAYKLARAGKSIEMPEREVTISTLELISYEYPYVECVCTVSSGTYIRTLVEDIGTALSTDAYCIELRRLKIGNFTIADAATISGALEAIN